MQISNLKVGQIVKNYNELCKILGVKPKPSNNTNGRKAHHKEFERYFSYDKQGQKYTITNIHSKIKDKVDNRVNNKGGNNKVYQEDFENLMVNTIHNKIDTEEMLLSKGQIFKVVELCNYNYTYARRNIPKLSELLEISKESIYDFYDNNNSKLTSIVERNLKAMRSKSMLMYESVVCVCINDSLVLLNELRKPIVKNDKVISFNEKVHREATKEEKALILKYENEAKTEMCVKDNKDIFLKGRWREYKELVEQKLKDNCTNIEYYYDSYKITWDIDRIEEAYNKLSNEQINSSRNDINNNIIKSIDKSTKTRHTKAKNKHDKYDIDIFRSSDTYVDEQLKISDTIINRNTKDLRNQLKQSVKVANNTKTMSNIETEQLELKWDLQSLSNDVPF